MGSQIGKWLIGVGIVLIVVGVLFLLRERFSFLKYLGHLPGDIAIEKENFHFYFPLATSLLVSLILSALLYILSRWR